MTTRHDLRHALYQSLGGLVGLIAYSIYVWKASGSFLLIGFALIPATFAAHLVRGSAVIDRWRLYNPDVSLYDACFGPPEAAPEARTVEDEEDT